LEAERRKNNVILGLEEKINKRYIGTVKKNGTTDSGY